jgi:hypothetical protein
MPEAGRPAKVVDTNGHSEFLSNSEAIKREVYRSAREMTMLSSEMTDLKNYYENKLIQMFT